MQNVPRIPGVTAACLAASAASPETALARSAGEPRADSLGVRAIQSGRWVVTEGTTVRIRLTSSFPDEVFVDSARWVLPGDLACGERGAEAVTQRLTGTVGIREGESYDLHVAIPAVGRCLPPGILRPARTPLAVTLWYDVPGDGSRTSDHEVLLAWAAPDPGASTSHRAATSSPPPPQPLGPHPCPRLIRGLPWLREEKGVSFVYPLSPEGSHLHHTLRDETQ